MGIGQPKHSEVFKHNRVPIGEVIDTEEFGRRICYELQLPQRFGTRLHRGFSRLIKDAITNGEGIRFHGVGAFRIKPHNDPYVRLPTGGVAKRKTLFKLVFSISPKGTEALQGLNPQHPQSTFNYRTKDASSI